MFLWRALDDEGVVLGIVVQKRRDTRGAPNRSMRDRERKTLGCKSDNATQRFLTLHAAVFNAFNCQRHTISRQMLQLFRARAVSFWGREVT